MKPEGIPSGALVADSMARFLPFGGYRSDGSQPVDGAPSNGGDLSDRGFTGHYENREIGLTYMQAPFYAPELHRDISAETPWEPITTPAPTRVVARVARAVKWPTLFGTSLSTALRRSRDGKIRHV